MNLNPDTLTTVFGAIASLSQVLEQIGVIDKGVSTGISAAAVLLLGIFSNKQITQGK
jgi:hypothetical protein